MPSRLTLLVAAVSALVASFFFLEHARRHRRARSRDAERSLWTGLAESLFDSAENPARKRIEIALGAVAKRLRVRGAMVTLHGSGSCRLLVGSEAAGASLLSGLGELQAVPRSSVYCGSLPAGGRCLAIDYASLSEWRRHAAYAGRGWECYLGASCGSVAGQEVVVAFLDSVPRDQIFDAGERLLVEQLAPWIASMVAEAVGEAAPVEDIPVVRAAESGIL